MVSKLSFDQLKDDSSLAYELHGSVEIRGFFYESHDGRHFLASQPDLKSCCVGTAKKVTQQIVLLGDIPPIPRQRAVLLKGVFATQPTFNAANELISLYSLKEIEVCQTVGNDFFYFLAVFFALLLLSIKAIKKIKNLVMLN